MKTPAILFVLLFSCSCLARAESNSDIEYGKADDVSLRLDARLPDGDGPFPAVIIIHGGGWSSGDKRLDAPGSQMPPVLDDLTAAGFAWFSINYRLAPQHRWPACLEDVQTAIRWIKSHAAEYRIDPDRIALLGYSAGGHLAIMAVLQADQATCVQAIVGLSPPTDLELDLPQRGGLSQSLQNLLGYPHELTDESRVKLREISPINHLKPGLPPMLIIHGTADRSVPYEGSVTFAARLRELGVPCELITIKDAPHRIRDWDKFDANYRQKLIEWLGKTLKNQASRR